jgi:hypothetical protein
MYSICQPPASDRARVSLLKVTVNPFAPQTVNAHLRLAVRENELTCIR